jgi:hypothetical protein
MAKQHAPKVVPDPAWATPAPSWREVIERYTTFLQVPTWRASVKRGGEEKATCLSASEAEGLKEQMLRALERAGDAERTKAKSSPDDLAELWRQRGRMTPRSKRCPSKLQAHFQRAFLLDASGYACPYCRRTAWGVYAEECGRAPRRTLRFEVDHRITRRRLTDPDQFDAKNLVAACRSCNVIKAEMLEDSFLLELASLSRAVNGSRGTV